MFEMNDVARTIIEEGYKTLLIYCCPCVIENLKNFDEQLFKKNEFNSQEYFAKMGAQVIEACSYYNAHMTLKEDHVLPEKLDCCTLMAHYIKASAMSDFRVRWEVMKREMDNDLNRKKTKDRFSLANLDFYGNFIQLYLNYRADKNICTFGERHSTEIELFINEEERANDTKMLKMI